MKRKNPPKRILEPLAEMWNTYFKSISKIALDRDMEFLDGLKFIKKWPKNKGVKIVFKKLP